MADPIQGALEVQTTADNATRITLDPESADVTVGGNGGGGDLILRFPDGSEAVRLGRIQETTAGPDSISPTVLADYTGLRIRDGSGRSIVQIGRRKAGLTLLSPADEIRSIFGAEGSSGIIELVDKNGGTRFQLGEVLNHDGQLVVRDAAGREVLRFNSIHAALYVGANGNEGDIIVRDGAGREVHHLDGNTAAFYVGASGNEGDIIVRDGAGRTAFHLDGNTAALYIGTSGNEGDIFVRDGSGRNVFQVDGNTAAVYIGASGNEGDLFVRDGAGRNVLHFDANRAALYLGAQGNEGDIIIRNNDGNTTIQLDGNSGDIILSNADCAEEFDVGGSEAVEPGTVMVLDPEGKLRRSEHAYDKKVAGVISGAGGYRPGILLDRSATPGNRTPVALVGKVFCRVDATHGAIDVGDLLTTSSTPGHAMKAADPLRAFGAVIGKALRAHTEGIGLIPIMVALQ